MDLKLNGKVALVTGSSQGIGLNIAKFLLREGCKVMFNGRNKQTLEKVVEDVDGDSAYSVADVTKKDECEDLINAVINQWKKIDILICNVGSGKSVAPGEETEEIWQESFSTNFFSATNMIESSIPGLVKTQGNIVCISSICGIETLPGAPIPYSCAKSALNMLVKGLSRPLAEKNIRINAVAPGNILFPGSVWEKKMQSESEKIENMLRNDVALQRLGNAEEVASLVAYLASEQASFITGSIYPVDGRQLRS